MKSLSPNKKKATEEGLIELQEAIKNIQGSFALTYLTYDENGQPNGAQNKVIISGHVHDIVALAQEVHNNSHAFMEDFVKKLSPDEAAHLMSDMLGG